MAYMVRFRSSQGDGRARRVLVQLSGFSSFRIAEHRTL